MKEQLENHYKELKEVLDVLPTKTKNNRQKKKDYLKEEEQENNKNIYMVLDEIKRRINPLINLEPNPQINEMINKLNAYYSDTDTSVYSSAYEKMHLDFYLYNIKESSKDNLSDVNKYLRKVIDSFKKANLIIEKDDFDFSTYASDYMGLLIGGASDEQLKEKFDEVYWKFPELIKTIIINIQSIYIRSEKKLNKFFEDYAKHLDKTLPKEEVRKNIIEYNKNLKKQMHTDKWIIFDNFKTGKWSVNTFSKAVIDSKINKYFTEDSYNFETLINLSKILFEYYLIIKYDYLLKDMKEKLSKKDEYKDSMSKALDEIAKLEKTLVNLNKANNKESKFKLFKKNNDEKWLFNYNNALKELIEKYDNLDNERFNDVVYRTLLSDSSILDVLRLISSNYLYFVSTYIKNKTSDLETINKEFEELREDINYKEFTMINSIALLDDKPMKEVISSRYKLEGINIPEESLEENTITSTMNDINELIRYENIKTSTLNLDDIELYLEMDKITDRK